MNKLRKPKDLPREELLALAEDFKRKCPNAELFFKFTCQHCGERNTFTKPNVLFEKGTCSHCGKTTPVSKGGFLVQFTFGFNKK